MDCPVRRTRSQTSFLRQALACLAVAGGLGRDRGEALIVAVLLEAVDGVITGVVVGEDLGEEETEGDPGGVDPLAPGVVAVTARGFDERPREELEEGKSLILIELIPHGIEPAARGSVGRLDHGDLLGLVTGGCVRTTKLPTKEVAYLSRKDCGPKSCCRKLLGYPRAIRVRPDSRIAHLICSVNVISIMFIILSLFC